MKKILHFLLILLLSTVSYEVWAGNAAGSGSGGDGNTSHDENGSGDTEGDGEESGEPGDEESDNCSVVFQVNAGSFAHEFGKRDVNLRIKRGKPTPLLFTPESLAFDSPLVTEVLEASESSEAQAVNEAQLAKDAAQLDLDTVTQGKDAAQIVKDQAEADVAFKTQERDDAQAALDADPGNAQLQQELADAEAALDAATDALDQAILNLDAAIIDLADAQQTFDDALAELTQAQAELQQQINDLTNAGSLVSNVQGIPVGRIALQRPIGSELAYAPSTIQNLWKPLGEQTAYISRLKSLGSNLFEQVDGIGNRLRFSTATGALPSFTTRTGRSLSLNTGEVQQEIISNFGVLRQVVTAQALSDIAIVDEYGYEIRMYYTADRGQKNAQGVYEPTGTPFATFKIENPTRDINQLNQIRITSIKGPETKVSEWTYSGSAQAWGLTRGAGEDQQTIVKTITDVDATDKVLVWDTFNHNNELVYTKSERVREFPWGVRPIEKTVDPGGANLVRQFEYYENPNEGRYAKAKSELNADGSWIVWDYDDLGREILKIEPWLDSSFATPANQAKATYSDYSAVDPLDTALEYDTRPRTVTVKTLDVVTKKTYYAYYTNASGEFVEIEEKAVSQEAAYGDASNLRHTKTYYASTADPLYAGKLKTEVFPNGRMDTYSYQELPDDSLVTTVTHGVVESPAGVAYKTTQEVITEDAQGNEIKRETKVYNGSTYGLAETIEQDFNARGKLTERRRNGRITYEATYNDALLKTSETDEQGITTLFTYDSLDRVKTETKVGISVQQDIVTTYTYNARDKIIEKKRESGGLSLTETWSYDKADRLLSATDAASYTTTYTYENDGRTITRTLPNTATVKVERFIDGKLKERSGNGIVDEYNSYTVNPDGSILSNSIMGRSDSLRTKQSTVDLLGRVIERRRPGFDGNDFVQTFSYNDQGLLVKKTETELADTLFEYDAARHEYRSGLDVDGNGMLDLASMDRITESEEFFEADANSHWWQVEQNRVFAEDNSAVATVVNESKERINGYIINQSNETVIIDIQGNETNVSVMMDRSTSTMTITTDAPDSSLDAVKVYENGLLTSETTKSVAEPVLYTYDALERLIARKDPRHMQTAQWDYNADNALLTAQRDAAGNQVNYAYHAQEHLGAGQIKSLTNPLGKVEYHAYNARGQQTRTWGQTAYPVEITYNEFGEQVSIATYRTGDAMNMWIQSEWPLVPPSGDVTTWAYDEATGLLTAKTDAAGEAVTYDYTTARRMSDRYWARPDSQGNPLHTAYTYDSSTGERTGVDYADSTPDITYTFDRMGRIDSVTDATGLRSFEYNNDLQLESETIASFYGTDKRITRNYETGTPGTNVVGRYTGFEVGVTADPDADYSVSYGFDAYGRLNSVTDANSTYNYAYLANSDLLETLVSPVQTTTYSYESERNLKTMVDNAAGGSSTSKYSYSYDALGRRTNRIQEGSAFAQANFDAFGYNDRSEVTASDRYLGTDTLDTSNPVVNDAFNYKYDPIGNRLSSSSASGSVNYTTNALNQYSAVAASSIVNPTHDEDGNLTAQGDWIYEWNAENRLIEAYSVTEDKKLNFTYDYLGRRVQKSVTEISTDTLLSSERFLYNDWNLISKYSLQTSNYELQTSYTWGLDLSQTLQGAGGVGGLLSAAEVSGIHQGVYHFSFDVNGNVSEVLDNTSNIVAHYNFDPFGNLVDYYGTYAGANSYRFSTKYFDGETSLYYYGYRHYDPEIGRWLSKDPLGEQAGPNLFCFIFNNSVNFWDFLGLAKTTVKVTTEIRQSTVSGPLGGKYEGGVKTEHSVTVDTNSGKITNESKTIHDSTKVNWDGSKNTKPGSGDLSSNLTQNNDGSLNLNMKGDADNPHLPSPHINYDIDVTIDSSGEVTNIEGGMDGFPSTSIDVNGETVFDNQEGNLSQLWGDDDVKINDENLDLSKQGKPCGSS